MNGIDKNDTVFIKSSDEILIKIEDDIRGLKKKMGQSKPYFQFKSRNKHNFENKPVKDNIYINRRNGKTITSQVVEYNDTSEISHLHCKCCGSEWKENSRTPIREMFLRNSEFLECIKCGARTYFQ